MARLEGNLSPIATRRRTFAARVAQLRPPLYRRGKSLFRVRFMTITISSSFDAGNIRVVSQSGDRADLEIVTDHM